MIVNTRASGFLKGEAGFFDSEYVIINVLLIILLPSKEETPKKTLVLFRIKRLFFHPPRWKTNLIDTFTIMIWNSKVHLMIIGVLY